MEKNNNKPKLRFPGFTDPWEQRKLKQLANFAKGRGYSKNDLTDVGTPIILYGRLYTKYQSTISEVDTFVVPKSGSVYSTGEEVIVPASGETAEDIARASAVVKSDFLLGGDLNIIYPNKDISTVFLALSISNGKQQKELSKRAQGKSVVHLRNSDLEEVTISFPCRDEQERIGSLFEYLDNLITLHQRKLNHLQDKKKGLLQKMFPKNGERFPELRFPGFTEAWEQRKLGEITNSIDTGRSKFVSNSNGEYEILGSTSVIGYDDNYDYEGDFLLTARVGANAGELYRHSGRVKISDNTVFIQGKNLNFIFYMLMNFDIKKLSFGTGQPLIKASELRELELMLPKSSEEQQKIGTFFNSLDNLITLHQRKLEHLQQQKKGLLQQMFI